MLITPVTGNFNPSWTSTKLPVEVEEQLQANALDSARTQKSEEARSQEQLHRLQPEEALHGATDSAEVKQPSVADCVRRTFLPPCECIELIDTAS